MQIRVFALRNAPGSTNGDCSKTTTSVSIGVQNCPQIGLISDWLGGTRKIPVKMGRRGNLFVDACPSHLSQITKGEGHSCRLFFYVEITDNGNNLERAGKTGNDGIGAI
jgi:hypothetical protein